MIASSRSNRSVALGVGFVAAALGLGACSSSEPKSPAEAQKLQSEVDVRLDASTDLIKEFRAKLSDDVVGRTKCMVVVPSLKKGGLIVGAESGQGFATCASGGAWSSPAPITMGGGTVGAQVGYQSGDALALVVSDSGAKALKAGNFKIGASASAAAGPVGTGTSKAGDVGVKSDVLTYTRASGLFAGATLDGLTVSADDEATKALYGTHAELETILARRVTLPQRDSVQRFVGVVDGAFPPAKLSLDEQHTIGATAGAR